MIDRPNDRFAIWFSTTITTINHREGLKPIRLRKGIHPALITCHPGPAFEKNFTIQCSMLNVQYSTG
ncbi:hypothetical protein [Gracilimonas sediminicola]|uniref:Uncharacterized protein n=1 Tax=Gracilimonas sediminicola TaxID=2952158 RepID=A0A9X2L3I8_9BACT|nr:hypothetical protein [Gracilimonas sediminicola]MCP9291639.1 hypothetical protein [Gracilimonas sediminicola]